MLERLVTEKNGFSAVFTHALKRKANKQTLTKILSQCTVDLSKE